jgi:hypothetical protein
MKNIDNLYLIIILVICILIFLLCTNTKIKENFYTTCPVITAQSLDCNNANVADYIKKRTEFLKSITDPTVTKQSGESCSIDILNENNNETNSKIDEINSKKRDLYNKMDTSLLKISQNKDLAELEEMNISMVREHRIANSKNRKKWIKIQYIIYIVLIISFLVIQAFLLFFLL